MPVPKRRRQKPADMLADLHPELRRDMEKGYSFFHKFESLEHMQDAWDAFGPDLLAEWILANPGTRPFAWWVCEHKQERPILKPDPYEAVRRKSARFGFLNTRMYGGPTMTPYQQDETEYLIEHGLLSDDELNRIPIEEEFPEGMDHGIKLNKLICRGPRRPRPA